MTTPIPIPEHLAQRLSTRAYHILSRSGLMQSCQELLALQTLDFFQFRGSGKKTVHELIRLQGRLLQQYPHLQPGYDQAPKVLPPHTKTPGQTPATAAADLSILNRALPELFRLSSLSSPCQSGSGTIGSLGLPAADLERLRSIAVFPEDSMHLLDSVTTGYLLQTGLSDSALSIMLCAFAGSSDLAKAASQSMCAPDAPDVSLYAELPPDLLDPLVIPGFPFPALLGMANGETVSVPWGAVAKITERTVVRTLGWSVAALRAIRYLWQLQERAVSIAEFAQAGLPTKAYGDFDRLTDAYLEWALQFAVARKCGPRPDQERVNQYRQLLRSRLRLVDGSKCPLRELGRRYGVTGERIRQMESKVMAVLKSPKGLRHLDYLWHLLDRLLETGGGTRYLSELSVSLGDLQGWTTLPSEAGLASIMELSPNYQVFWDPPIRVTLTAPGCVGCAIGAAAVFRALETAPDTVLSFDAALEAMREACQRERCPKLRKCTGFSKSLIHFLADPSVVMTAGHVRVCFRDLRSREKARRNQVLEHMLLAAGKELHFTEVQREFNRSVSGKPASEPAVHKWLTEHPALLLWGQGTFKHRDLVRLPMPLIMDIQQDLAARLDSGAIPYLCLNGKIFNDYEDRLSSEGVPNPPALYSCMRTVGSDALAFTGYPYVLKKDGPGRRLSIEAVLEGYVSSRSGPVASEQIRAFALLELGIPADQLGNHFTHARNLIRVGDLWVHRSQVPMLTDRLGAIIQGLSKIEPPGPIAQAWIFQENLAACEAMGITQAAHLTSLIRHFFPGKIEISRHSEMIPKKAATVRPRPRPAAKSPAPHRISAEKMVLLHLEEQAKPCKTRELSILCRKTVTGGFLASHLRYKGKLLWYTKDSVIAREALQWSRQKQGAIEAMAFRHLEERTERGKPYGLCSKMYRDMGSELPEIAPHLIWTPVLLQDLLGTGYIFICLGGQRDLFVARRNPQGIATLNDLILHTLVTDFGGSAPLRAFNSALRKSGLMQKNTLAFLEGKDPRVIIEDDVIRVADRSSIHIPKR